MVVYAGKNTFVLVGKEDTFGTTATTDKSIGIITGVSAQLSNNLIDIRSIGNRQKEDIIVGNADASLSVEGDMNSGALFSLMFGQEYVTTTSSDRQHWFVDTGGGTVVTNTGHPFSISTNYDSTTDLRKVFVGCKVNSIELNFERGGKLQFSADILATKVGTLTTVGTETLPSTTVLGGFQGTISTGDDTSETEVGLTRSVTMSITQGIDPNDVKAIGSRFSQDLVEKNLDVGVRFTKTFADHTELARFLGGAGFSPTSTPTDTSLIFNVNNGVTLGSGRVQLYVKLKGGQYETYGEQITQDGIIEQEFVYRGGFIEDLYYIDAQAQYFS